MAYETGDRWYLGRVEERQAKSPAEISYRLQGMSVELGEVFPGGFSPNHADGVPPHRYARTDLFPHDPDHSLETVDAVSQPDEFVTLLMQQYVAPQTNITLDMSLIDAVQLPDGVTSAKFRGEESVRSIIKEEAVRAYNASWGVDAWGRFFFLQKRTSAIGSFREGVDIVSLEESRDRDLLFNRVMLTGGYVYHEELGSDISMRGFYRWRGNYIQPASRDQHGERRIRLWIPWIRTASDSRQFVKEFFRIYAQPTSRYLVEVANQTSVPVPWGGRIVIKAQNGTELIAAMVETIRVQFDHAPRIRLEIGPEDPHTHWPEPPHDERWEIPGNNNQGGGSEISISSGDEGPESTAASSSASLDSSGMSGGMSSGTIISGNSSGGESGVGESSSGESGGGESGTGSGGESGGESGSGGESSGGSGGGSGTESGSGSGGIVCETATASASQNVNDGNDVAWVAGGGSGSVTLDRQDTAQTLQFSDFDFELPAGKSVVGITATVNIISPDNEVDGIEAGTVGIVSGSKTGGKDLFSGDNLWPTTATDKVLGGDSETWGEDWTTDDFNSTELKVNLTQVEQSDDNDEHDATVNSVTLRVCYAA